MDDLTIPSSKMSPKTAHSKTGKTSTFQPQIYQNTDSSSLSSDTSVSAAGFPGTVSPVQVKDGMVTPFLPPLLPISALQSVSFKLLSKI